jgi:hypothetical protein
MPRVGAACAKGRDLVRRIAHEQHAAVVELVHAPALEGVDADPFQLEFAVIAQHGLDARDDVLGLLLLLRVGIPAELEVDAPDVVGLRCSSTDWLGWKGGSNQNQRSAGKSAFITTSAIRKRSMKILPSMSSPSMRADGAARAVGHHQPVGRQGVGAVGRFHAQRGAIAWGALMHLVA